MRARLTERETNELLLRLEERRYGRRFNSMQLAQKAGVSLDEVNRVENQLPAGDAQAAARIARTLGVRPDLLARIAGLEEMSNDELNQLHACLRQPSGETPPECERIGLQPLTGTSQG